MHKILIVDDDWLIRAEVDEMLKGLGYQVAGEAENGEEAVARVRELKPDLILMDIKMPGKLNGIDVARKIKNETGTPIVFMTGFGDPDFIEAAKEVAPFGYVMKPFDEKEIHAFVEIALHKRELELELEKARLKVEEKNRRLRREIEKRKQTEARLRESEARFRSIYEQSPIGIEVFDHEGKLLHVNDACLKIFGISDISEVKGFRLFEDPNLSTENKARLRKSLSIQYEVAFDFEKVKAGRLYETSKSGIIYLQVKVTPLSPASGVNTGGYLVQILDITESKQNLHALEESRNRFEILFDGISDAIFIQDAVGHILDVNREACARLGYSRREMLTLSVSDFDPDHRQVESVQEKTSRILQSGPMKFESRHRTRNGEIIHVELKSSRFRHDGKDFFVTIARDITDRKQMEKALKESKKKLNAILDSLSDMILEIDSEMTILWANRAALQMNPDAIGQTCYAAFPGRTGVCEGCFCLKAFETGETETGVLYQPSSKTAGESYWENFGIPLTKGDGSQMTVLEVSRNVTERVRAEAEKERLIRELKVALKEVKTLSGLLPICSHCKKIRDDKGYWNLLESFISTHSEATFSHSICPECAKKFYPEYRLYDE